MSIEERIKDATKQVVLSFQPTFVQTMDRMRHRMGAFYRPTSTLVWNGELISGADSIAAFYNTLPITNTVFTTFDVQPLVSLFPPFSISIGASHCFYPSFFFSTILSLTPTVVFSWTQSTGLISSLSARRC